MSNIDQERFQDYPVFKGLQKPLEFMGLKGRYIYWAAGAVGGMIFIKQHKGLHSKKSPKGIFIYARSKSY